MDEPLRHNKTAFVIDRLGASEVNRLKTLANRLNQRLGSPVGERVRQSVWTPSNADSLTPQVDEKT